MNLKSINQSILLDALEFLGARFDVDPCGTKVWFDDSYVLELDGPEGLVHPSKIEFLCKNIGIDVIDLYLRVEKPKAAEGTE